MKYEIGELVGFCGDDCEDNVGYAVMPQPHNHHEAWVILDLNANTLKPTGKVFHVHGAFMYKINKGE